ncbi:MAG: hypothetical protein M0Z45_02135 [Actinomycetota bacterium]|nr:hypothetical protein [Actinomycetota bacterium]
MKQIQDRRLIEGWVRDKLGKIRPSWDIDDRLFGKVFLNHPYSFGGISK